MFEIRQNGFFTLNNKNVTHHVPGEPGVFILALQLPNGVHRAYYIRQTDNLHRSLKSIKNGFWQDLPSVTQTFLEKFQPYFTFFIVPEPDYRQEIEKMLTQTNDPVTNLTLFGYC